MSLVFFISITFKDNLSTFFYFNRETPAHHQVGPEGKKIVPETLHHMVVRETKQKQKPTHTVTRSMAEQQQYDAATTTTDIHR